MAFSFMDMPFFGLGLAPFSALLNASTGFIIVFFTIFRTFFLVLGGRTLVNTLVAIFNACAKSMENFILLHPFTLQLAWYTGRETPIAGLCTAKSR